ncbi:MepB family protein [Paenibacillus sp. FSL H7-0716]|uniref:MepB family protein n=1 Tax=Paenibacillus TaxID=44249 RepID=UPI002115FDC6|nr:MepB family protein [Paenibacillus odorifer]
MGANWRSSLSDPTDLFVISTRNGNHFGPFIFPKAVLGEQDILSDKGEGGKRAFRVYPPWDNPTSRQAQKTQTWQSE